MDHALGGRARTAKGTGGRRPSAEVRRAGSSENAGGGRVGEAAYGVATARALDHGRPAEHADAGRRHVEPGLRSTFARAPASAPGARPRGGRSGLQQPDQREECGAKNSGQCTLSGRALHTFRHVERTRCASATSRASSSGLGARWRGLGLEAPLARGGASGAWFGRCLRQPARRLAEEGPGRASAADGEVARPTTTSFTISGHPRWGRVMAGRARPLRGRASVFFRWWDRAGKRRGHDHAAADARPGPKCRPRRRQHGAAGTCPSRGPVDVGGTGTDGRRLARAPRGRAKGGGRR